MEIRTYRRSEQPLNFVNIVRVKEILYWTRAVHAHATVCRMVERDKDVETRRTSRRTQRQIRKSRQ